MIKRKRRDNRYWREAFTEALKPILEEIELQASEFEREIYEQT